SAARLRRSSPRCSSIVRMPRFSASAARWKRSTLPPPDFGFIRSTGRAVRLVARRSGPRAGRGSRRRRARPAERLAVVNASTLATSAAIAHRMSPLASATTAANVATPAPIRARSRTPPERVSASQPHATAKHTASAPTITPAGLVKIASTNMRTAMAAAASAASAASRTLDVRYVRMRPWWRGGPTSASSHRDEPRGPANGQSRFVDSTSTPAATGRLAGARRNVPGLRMLSEYRAGWLPHDVVAGLVLTTLLVPQGMAYAELAGLPAITGLYTSIMCLLGYAVFGPSPVLVLGPDSSLGPMIAAVIIPIVGAQGDPERAI